MPYNCTSISKDSTNVGLAAAGFNYSWRSFFVAMALLLCSAGLNAQIFVIHFAAGPEEPHLTDATGVPIADGNLVQIGYFDDGFDVFSGSANLITMTENFNALGTTTVRSIFSQPGRFADSVSISDFNAVGSRLHLLSYKTFDNGAPTASFDNVTEFGLFTNSSSDDWLLPSGDVWDFTTLLGTSDVLDAVHGNVSVDGLSLVAVPEPAFGTVVMALGVLALALWRTGAICRLRLGPTRSIHWLTSLVKRRVHFLPFIILLYSPKQSLGDAYVNYTAQLGQRSVLRSSGSSFGGALGEVRLGVFADGFEVVHQDDLRRMLDGWIELGSTEIREIFGESGRFSATAYFDRPALEGDRLYLLILRTSDGGNPSYDLHNVVEAGLFSSGHPTWSVPSHENLAPGNGIIIHTSQIDESFGWGDVTEEGLRLSAVAPPVDDYETWALSSFDSGIPISESMPDADPDRDGVVNRMEWFGGTNPLSPNRPPIQMLKEGETLFLEIRRARRATRARFKVEHSNDLLEWQSVEPSDLTWIEPSDRIVETFLYPLPPQSERLDSRGQLFFRLRVGD